MIRSCDIAVVGAGFAGLAAAETLAGSGLDVRIIDENPRAGGQLLRTFPGVSMKAGKLEFDGIKRAGFRILRSLSRMPAEIIGGAQALGIFPGNMLVVQTEPESILELKARFIVIAAGAREKFLPFPGWTLPGVISTGAAQILMKSSGILPAAETLVGGLGPLPFALAGEIALNGGRVTAVLDHSTLSRKLALLRTLPHQILKLLDGARLMADLLTAGIPVRSGVKILEARGRKQLESVAAAETDRTGAPIPGTERVYPAECLAVGFGFAPNIELALQCGCAADYLPESGGWSVRVNDGMETTVENVFAAGEVTGIAGARKSLIEGRIAGLSILEKLGYPRTGRMERRNDLLIRRRREQEYGKVLNALCKIPSDWVKAIPGETVVCRCEDLRMRDIRKALSDGFDTPNALKRRTRCGMGNCQGRICGPVVIDLLTAERGGAFPTDPPSIRFPVKPAGIAGLARIGSGE
jgi:NADPH-dependent 2,4-dienoyl-CoA reductase/sulfur reductase-like enzyme